MGQRGNEGGIQIFPPGGGVGVERYFCLRKRKRDKTRKITKKVQKINFLQTLCENMHFWTFLPDFYTYQGENFSE